MDGAVEYCPYAVLCRVSPAAKAAAPEDIPATSDLLVAIDRRKLHVFARKSDSGTCIECASLLKPTTDTSKTSGSFHCPHIASYVDVAHTLAIPVASILQIIMTYQTSTMNGVAKRTKDLLIRIATPTAAPLLLWLEFEHNLARGWFLEALTTASSPSIIDMDYLDLSDSAAVKEQLSSQYRGSASALFMPVLLVLSLPVFLRDAWRHIIFDKVKLALQIAHDHPASIDCSSDATVSLLLTTAVELATRLDEPDLIAFTWLASGFLNAQATGRGGSHALASAQVLHSLTVAKEYSLEYLTCLALQCAADIHLRLGGGDEATTFKARELLREAAKLLTISDHCTAIEPSLKMQLHAKLHDLLHTAESSSSRSAVPTGPVIRAHSVAALLGRRDLLAATRSGSTSSLADTPSATARHKAMAFSLWTHVFGTAASAGPANIKSQLLSRVPRLPGATFKCVVDVLGAHGVKKARLRVFYDAQSTVGWLVDHVAKRFTVVHRCGPEAGDGNERVQLELLYDPQRKALVPHDAMASLAQWIQPHEWTHAASPYVLHAKLRLAVVSSHRSSMAAVNAAAAVDDRREDSPSVLCSLCGHRIALEQVESHSETCFGQSNSSSKN